jgi:hypothetical protein
MLKNKETEKFQEAKNYFTLLRGTGYAEIPALQRVQEVYDIALPVSACEVDRLMEKYRDEQIAFGADRDHQALFISDEELADMESRELAYRAEVEEAEAEHHYAMGQR